MLKSTFKKLGKNHSLENELVSVCVVENLVFDEGVRVVEEVVVEI